MELQEIEHMVKTQRVSFISLQFVTVAGDLRQVVLPARDIREVLEHGCGFDGSSAGFTTVEKSDLVLRPDPSTFMILPWGEERTRTARFICEVFSADGTAPMPLDPRGALKRVIEGMKREFGPEWSFCLAPELEFYLLVKDELGRFQPHDQAGYFAVEPADKGAEIRKRLSLLLDSMGFVCQKNHHEVPKGKHEINFAFGPALQIADATVTYKLAVKNLAAQHGLVATFMPKPFYGTYGTGMHVHLNLRDEAKGENLFRPSGKEEISSLGRHFMAGLLAHARALAGLTNPSVNSYKRLVPGWEAPVYIAWGRWNRSALLRIPSSTPGARRVEFRCPDASCNPYLAFAGILAAGLDGIRRSLALPDPVELNIYTMTPDERRSRGIGTLPRDLEEALECLEADRALREAVGEEIISRFLQIKRREWEDFATAVHPWELERYLDV
jgi:glutamine synthetase